MQWTEDLICEHLDGTFTRVLPCGTIKTVSVAGGETPAPATDTKKGGRPLGVKVGPIVPWAPHDETILRELRRMGWPFSDIAWKLGRSLEATKKHYQVLRVRGDA